jgi:anaerobic magnesium-protoporphyrin IX monomethyl ester cyclase
MKILLINPYSGNDNPLLPLGLAYIAAFLEKNNFKVDVLDADALKMPEEEMEKYLLSLPEEPAIVGVTMMTAGFYAGKKTIETVKRVLPKSIIITGGNHVSALPEETLKEISELDFAVKGEGEITMLELVKALENKGDFKNIKGIYYRENGQIIATSPRELITDLDSLPLPAREKFPLDKYKTHPPYGLKNPYMHMITSRGCPYGCAYCSKSVFGRILRMRSAINVVDEIEELIEKYGIKEIKFYDDDFTLDMKRAEAICDEILKRKITIPWSCATRVDLVSEPLLKKMKQAGCWLIAYGVESGCQDLIDLIGKGIKLEQVINAFSWTARARIKTLAYFMVGLPGETVESIKKTIEFAKKIKPDFVSWSLTTIFPATPLKEIVRERVKSNGRIVHYTSNPKDMYRLNWDQEPLFIYEENISIPELKKYVTRAYIEFYLRPKYIFSQLLKIRSAAEFIYYFRAFLNMLKIFYGKE